MQRILTHEKFYHSNSYVYCDMVWYHFYIMKATLWIQEPAIVNDSCIFSNYLIYSSCRHACICKLDNSLFRWLTITCIFCVDSLIHQLLILNFHFSYKQQLELCHNVVEYQSTCTLMSFACTCQTLLSMSETAKQLKVRTHWATFLNTKWILFDGLCFMCSKVVSLHCDLRQVEVFKIYFVGSGWNSSNDELLCIFQWVLLLYKQFLTSQ